MPVSDRPLRERHPQAWSFHRNTSVPSAFVPTAMPTVPPAPANLEFASAPAIALPAPQEIATPLGRAMALRRSGRSFPDTALTLADVADVLQAGFGLRSPASASDGRLVPSAGALYPLECFLLVRRVAGLAPGLHHLALVAGALEFLDPIVPTADQLSALFLHQPGIADAALIVVIVAVPARTLLKYGDRGYRYVLLEAGHAAQNMNLVCAAKGLPCCNLGGFLDRPLTTLLGLDGEEAFPVYAQALGAASP